MKTIKRYRPAYFTGYADEYASFNSLDELMKIEWIASWKEHKDFYQFSVSHQYLICEVKNGNEWWVVGYFHDVYSDVIKWLPTWIKKK